MKLWQLLVIYFFIVNAAGFIIMGIDKWCAKKQMWRVPEKTLFLIAALGGSIGTNVGMYVFRHKTRHWYFVIGMPLILIAQVALGLWLKYR